MKSSMIGFAVGALSGLDYAIFLIFAKRTLTKVSSYTLVFYSNFFAAILLLPVIVTVPLPTIKTSWPMLLSLGIINTGVAVSLYYAGLSKVKAHEAAILAYAEPLTAAILGMVLLQQGIAPLAIIGGLLVIIAGSMITLQSNQAMTRA